MWDSRVKRAESFQGVGAWGRPGAWGLWGMSLLGGGEHGERAGISIQRSRGDPRSLAREQERP